MKVLLPLLALSLLLAGCTTPDESDDDADGADTNDSVADQRGGQVGGDVIVTEPEGNSSTNSTPSNSTG